MDKPFFLFLATHNIHVPRVPNAKFTGKSECGVRGDAIVEFDWMVGQVLDKLDKLGLAENTLVALSSDNGGVNDDNGPDKVHGIGDTDATNGHKSNGVLRGTKGTVFEGGTRVPFVVRWPAKVKPGTSDALMSQMDLLASFAALTGQDIPKGHAPASENHLEALLGLKKSGREFLVEQSNNGAPFGFRHGTWKLIPGGGPKANEAAPALFDLATDLSETKNLAAAKVTAMVAKLAAITGQPLPHTPLAVAKEWQGKSSLKHPYADCVMQTDAVVFTSDNGCAAYIGAKELDSRGHFPSRPLRGYKADAWEGGHRVPFVVRFPGMVKPGSTYSQTICSVDLMATLADVLGAKLPAAVGEDSVSLLPLLRGEDKPIHEAVVHHSAAGIFAVRSGKWKLILGPGSGAADGTKPHLYDLAADIGEKTDLAAKHPEEVERLTELLEKFVEDGRSTPGEKQMNDLEFELVELLTWPPLPSQPERSHLHRRLTPIQIGFQRIQTWIEWYANQGLELIETFARDQQLEPLHEIDSVERGCDTDSFVSGLSY